jgi:hypothetical protein
MYLKSKKGREPACNCIGRAESDEMRKTNMPACGCAFLVIFGVAMGAKEEQLGCAILRPSFLPYTCSTSPRTPLKQSISKQRARPRSEARTYAVSSLFSIWKSKYL